MWRAGPQNKGNSPSNLLLSPNAALPWNPKLKWMAGHLAALEPCGRLVGWSVMKGEVARYGAKDSSGNARKVPVSVCTSHAPCVLSAGSTVASASWKCADNSSRKLRASVSIRGYIARSSTFTTPASCTVTAGNRAGNGWHEHEWLRSTTERKCFPTTNGLIDLFVSKIGVHFSPLNNPWIWF